VGLRTRVAVVDNEKLRNLASEIAEVIEKYGIDFEMFAVNITVTEDYFESVKDKLRLEQSVTYEDMRTEIDERWAINVIRSREES
ncbi:MAG: hypothetical protein KC547_08305, partial [Anaerolineae bacterium]|nr:hypothetical protein [Anaerolineae bacterium]